MVLATKKPPKQKPRYWNEDEDKLLKAAIAEHGTEGYHRWKEVAKHVPNRSYRECMQRWTKVLAPGLKKGKWSSDEDEQLVRLVQEQLKTIGETNGKRIVWNKVSSGFEGRSCKQCRERWINHLDPSVKKTEWTHDEDLMLLQLYETIPSKWAKIARQIPGRTENMVKVRWNALNRQAKKRKQNAIYFPPNGQHMPMPALAGQPQQGYNQFYLNNQLSLNLGHRQAQMNAARAGVPRLSYPTNEIRKNSLYMFPGNPEFQTMQMNMNMQGFVKHQQNEEGKRKLSQILNGVPHKNMLTQDDIEVLRRNSSMAQIQKAVEINNQERRLSFSMNGFQMDDHNNDSSGLPGPGRRLSSYLYQDLLKSVPQNLASTLPVSFPHTHLQTHTPAHNPLCPTDASTSETKDKRQRTTKTEE